MEYQIGDQVWLCYDLKLKTDSTKKRIATIIGVSRKADMTTGKILHDFIYTILLHVDDPSEYWTENWPSEYLFPVDDQPIIKSLTELANG